ncbi:SMI1/KNR4 family protein [Kitasatospora sp. NPDC050463]|uniref:SMI1/KNR4 family protein n=1 Tax=Kitasatospora sp. NPDC050463 TaxID=3155786 RepID=UPI0033D3A823
MTEETFEWRPFLTRWSEEWAGARDDSAASRPEDEAARRAGWLGFEPATAERLAAAERRLGRRLPPSYRAFLEVTDGWRHAGGSVYRLAGTEGARWHEDSSGFSEYFDGELEGMWERALQLDTESDLTFVLLDPSAVDDDGEWAVYCHKVWAHSEPTRYGSFREFMVAMYREFHRLTAHRTGDAFENGTTRRLDACVEVARLDALRGAYGQAAAALAEAVDFGRPRAVGMLDQLRRLQGETYTVSYGELPPDPLYSSEVVPVLALEQVHSHHDAAVWGFRVRPASDEARAEADVILREVAELTYRYTAPGPFGAAVDQARELARWGAAEAAWHTLLAALPYWTPVGPDHLAPIGLLADAVLGPLVTPERGRELLATARGTGAPAVERSAGPAGQRFDEDGLEWLAGHRPGSARPAAYRFVLVEGAAPDELPARLGIEPAEGAEGSPGAALNAPMGSREAWQHRYGGGVSSSYDDRALAAVGWAGGSGWSFAFDAEPAPYHGPRFESPAAAASRGGGRAVVVWSEPAGGLFHLSVADGGAECYAFTVQGPEIRRTGGAIPPALDPERLLCPPAHGPQDESQHGPQREGERRALAAVAAEFGVSLPRFALTEGRLHTFTTRSWTRPPGPGETYVVATVGLPSAR